MRTITVVYHERGAPPGAPLARKVVGSLLDAERVKHAETADHYGKCWCGLREGAYIVIAQ